MKSVAPGVYTVLAEFQKCCVTPGVKVDFSKHDSSQLNRIFVKDGLRGMPEGMDSRTLEMFPFYFRYIDSLLGY